MSKFNAIFSVAVRRLDELKFIAVSREVERAYNDYMDNPSIELSVDDLSNKERLLMKYAERIGMNVEKNNDEEISLNSGLLARC